MSDAEFYGKLPSLYVSADWASATAVKAALLSQWKLDVGTTRTFVVTLWEGQADPDDWARVTITAGTAVATNNFTSQPKKGSFVFVTSIAISA